MSIKKMMANHTLEELATSFVFPVTLTPKQKKEADAQLKKERKKRAAEITENDKLTSRILQFKFQLEDNINAKQYNTKP